MLVSELIDELRAMPDTACVVVDGADVHAVVYDRGNVHIDLDDDQAAPSGECECVEGDPGDTEDRSPLLTAMTREDLEAVTCDQCSEPHEHVYLHARCHPDAGLAVHYTRGRLLIHCDVCERLVEAVQVASRLDPPTRDVILH